MARQFKEDEKLGNLYLKKEKEGKILHLGSSDGKVCGEMEESQKMKMK